MEITRILPDECQSLIISLTSPADACRSAIVSHAFKAVAYSDAVWEKFLPSDYRSILSGSSSSSSLLSLGKKVVYVHLCFHPILIQNGTMSFQLKKESEKKCYMLGARALSIIWGDTPSYWTWKSLPESRFAIFSMFIAFGKSKMFFMAEAMNFGVKSFVKKVFFYRNLEVFLCFESKNYY
ncbi:hypothetical protein E1A91_A09G217400v1 [Gossypium mustelinum]|uniref:F-box domain-containing protein n=1 Tax=Gossypium mustelinum TaxID=34275 RepID=A0A5D2Y0N2_GOSMU|nr:hypothetical protein E1A91_A09G217400v1 [Gossypium mustelinum]